MNVDESALTREHVELMAESLMSFDNDVPERLAVRLYSLHLAEVRAASHRLRSMVIS